MSCECMEPDPNEGNPFEPPETPEQQSRRVGRMIRENVNNRMRDKSAVRLPGKPLPSTEGSKAHQDTPEPLDS